jgi:opacity protein-like surface antigen
MYRFIVLFTAAAFLFPASASAQFEVGASYELRDESPQSGFGVRIQKGFLNSIPILNLGLRAHFSYFSEENSVSVGSGGTGQITYSEDFTNYDFGLDVIAGLSVGLIEPYAGVGLGSSPLDLTRSDLPADFPLDSDANESNIFWNLTVGAKVPVIPLVKPFVEYRYSNGSLSEPQLGEQITGRISFGVVLSF